MKQFKKLSHVVWDCKYHVVWCPKYRFRILKGDVAKSVRAIIRQLCEWKKIEILAGNVQLDHVHLVISFSPKYSASEVVGLLKGKSAIRIFDRHIDLKKKVLGTALLGKGVLCEHSRLG